MTRTITRSFAMYMNGTGVPKGYTKAFIKAFEWYSKAVAQGDAQA